MESSLVQSLRKSGLQLPFSFRKDLKFVGLPDEGSIKELIKKMNFEIPDLNSGYARRGILDYEYNSPRGVAFAKIEDDITMWFIANRNMVNKIFTSGDPYNPERVTIHLWKEIDEVIKEANLPNSANKYEGFGGIQYHNELLYVPLIGIKDTPSVLLVFDETLSVKGYCNIPDTGLSAFCAINKGNNLLYLASCSASNLLLAFDVSDIQENWENRKQLAFQMIHRPDYNFCFYDESGKSIDLSGVHGADFSNTGMLFISTYSGGKSHISIFSAFTGRRNFFSSAIDFQGGGNLKDIALHPSGEIYMMVEGNKSFLWGLKRVSEILIVRPQIGRPIIIRPENLYSFEISIAGKDSFCPKSDEILSYIYDLVLEYKAGLKTKKTPLKFKSWINHPRKYTDEDSSLKKFDTLFGPFIFPQTSREHQYFAGFRWEASLIVGIEDGLNFEMDELASIICNIVYADRVNGCSSHLM